KRRDEDPAFPREHRMPFDTGQDLDLWPGLADPGRTDEHGPEGLVVPLDIDVRLEARDLPPERVAIDGDVDQTESRAIEHDHSGARPEHRAVEVPDRVVEPVEPCEPHDRGGLATRDDQAVETVELTGSANLNDVS